ncbi:hypothetical protein [Bradyrhizobium genosp. P]|uniref:hypothetical protein n=1 Tax=Bradyrhizobium genosp. P TaxID=83641 RepID=UPI003CF2B294
MPREVLAMFRDHPAFLAALAAGERTFDPGRACWNGHKAERLVAGKQDCLECTRLRRAKNSTPVARRRPVPDHGTFAAINPQHPDTEKHATNAAAAQKRFGYQSSRFPSVTLSWYERSDLARERSDYCDRLLRERTKC